MPLVDEAAVFTENHFHHPVQTVMVPRRFAGGVLAAISWWALQPTRSETELSSRVAAVRYLGSQFQSNPLGVTGLDCASSILLPSGESFWVFGDTVEGSFKSIRGLPLADKLSNTAAIVPKQDVSQGIQRFQFLTQPNGKRPLQIVPFASDEDPGSERIWPIHGIPNGEDIYLFYHRIALIPGVDVFENFQLEGMGIAEAKVGGWKFERLLEENCVPHTLARTMQFCWLYHSFACQMAASFLLLRD